MQEKFTKILQKTIECSFCLLFFLVPLVLTPINYELFEYNKMMLTYSFTTIIVGAWIIKMVVEKKICIKKTPLDIPLFLFLLSQIISTAFSIDRHVSIWGYYSRFNGGLLSIISYILLYCAFVSNFPKEKINKLLFFVLSSGFLVAIYGILEHFGIDKNLWVQDVQNRVFSTLGQPNWLAAYLAVLIPITVGFSLNSKFEITKVLPFLAKPDNHLRGVREDSSKVKELATTFTSKEYFGTYRMVHPFAHLRGGKRAKLLKTNWLIGIYWIIANIFYITLIFTKSRSGFLGFWIANLIFWLILLLPQITTIVTIGGKNHQQFSQQSRRLISAFLIFNFSFLIFTFLLGAPFTQINRFALPELRKNQEPRTKNQEQLDRPLGSSIIEVGITESSKIRHIVWKGAVDIFRHYPLFGSGVETFAFSYYKFRPVEHNMTSEWDFLYNKAHNEYLNYAATTGAFGLGSYLLFIGSFIWWNIKKIKTQISNVKSSSKSQVQNNLDFGFDLNLWILTFGFFCSWLSILITNFFGFSVVVVQLFFYLIPAICSVLTENTSPLFLLNKSLKSLKNKTITNYQLPIILIVLFSIFYFLFSTAKLWYADTLFAEGFHASHTQEFATSYQVIKEAILLNKKEPLYYDELSYPAASLAVSFSEQKEATYSALLADEATLANQMAVTISPNNVNFWKTRTRVFYALSSLDEKYLQLALEALERAKELSPTDPKIGYNLAVLLANTEKEKEAVVELEFVTKIKPDYREAYMALSHLYEQAGQKEKAKEPLLYILTKIATDDAEAKERLEELEKIEDRR